MEQLHQDQQPPHHQLQPHPQLTDVDLHRGQMINDVTMKTTTPIATGMVVLVVTMMPADGTITVLHVNALIQITVVQQQLLQQQLPQLHLQMAVDPPAGPTICGVTMKTTMPIETGTAELVASMKPKDGIITAQYETFMNLTFYTRYMIFYYSYRIVSAKNVHHLDGMAITTVMTI